MLTDFILFFSMGATVFFKQHPWRLCVKWTTLLSFWLFCDRPVVRETIRWRAACSLRWHVWGLGSTQAPVHWMKCLTALWRVKKLVSCSVEKRQIYCRVGTSCLTVMGRAVVGTDWWMWLDKKTLEVQERSGFLNFWTIFCADVALSLSSLCKDSVV